MRSRLFASLAAAEGASVWVEGAPGSGKTTLAASWLDATVRPCIWYQVDAGDTDIATLFHFLAIALRHLVPDARVTLPHFTPEYALGLATFSRRFFSELFRHLPDGAVVVFDNAQEAAADELFSEVLRLALESVPAHVRVVCLSRSRPPVVLARLIANGNLTHIEPPAMRLTADEAQALASLRGVTDSATVAALHAQAHGWAAGLVLMLVQPAGERTAPVADAPPQLLFDYFMGEILLRTEDATRQFLMRTALLPTMQVADAEALAEWAGGGTILAELVRRNQFTYQLTPHDPVYEYHPLFRTFLLRRLEESVTTAEFTRLCAAAAHLLEQRAAIEQAAELYRRAGQWTALTAMIRRHAEHMIAEGRSRSLEAWLAVLPERVRAADGWLEYWLGSCRLAFNPALARTHYEQAYALFASVDDIAGRYLAWAGVIDTFMYQWDDFAQIDPWVGELERLQARHPFYPSAEIEARVTMGMLAAMTWRFAGHPALPDWAERALHIVLANPGSRLAMLLANHLVFYSLWDSDFPRAAVVIEALRPQVEQLRHDPLALLHWYVMDAMYSWFVADHAACLAAVEAGNRLAAETGVHLLDIYLNAQGVYSAVSVGDVVTARECMRRMVAAGPVRMLDKSLCAYMLASVAWLEGDLPRAIEQGEAAVHLATTTGAALAIGLCKVELAKTLFEANRGTEALACLEQAHASHHGRRFMEFLEDLHGAHFALASGDEVQALECLRRALPLGARQGYLNIPRWRPETMARLCALALAHGIAPDYACLLIRRRALVPPTAGMVPDTWPWPVRLHTLGGFNIEIDGVSLMFTHKAQRRPLDLLKVLIARAGRKVAAAELAEILWPDAEGDAAHRSLVTTVYRLRRLLRHDAAVEVGEEGVALSQRHCWVDAWTLKQALGNTEHALGKLDDSALGERLEWLLALYGGRFLEGSPCGAWALPLRDGLHSRLLRLLERVGTHYERLGAWEAAVALYHKGIELEPLAEAFYRRLMEAYRALGRTAEALAVYQRCREILATLCSIAPSAQTESLREAIVAAAHDDL